MSETSFHYYRHPGESRDLRACYPEDSGLRRNDDDFSLRPSHLRGEKRNCVPKPDYSAFMEKQSHETKNTKKHRVRLFRILNHKGHNEHDIEIPPNELKDHKMHCNNKAQVTAKNILHSTREKA